MYLQVCTWCSDFATLISMATVGNVSLSLRHLHSFRYVTTTFLLLPNNINSGHHVLHQYSLFPVSEFIHTFFTFHSE